MRNTKRERPKKNRSLVRRQHVREARPPQTKPVAAVLPADAPVPLEVRPVVRTPTPDLLSAPRPEAPPAPTPTPTRRPSAVADFDYPRVKASKQVTVAKGLPSVDEAREVFARRLAPTSAKPEPEAKKPRRRKPRR